MIRKIVFLFILVVVLVIFYGLASQIYNALQAGKRLDYTTSKLAELQRKNNELQKRLVEAGSLTFIEKQARDKLNLARSGETVVVIPQKEIDKVLGVTEATPAAKLPNWQGWLRLLFY